MIKITRQKAAFSV